MTDITKPIPAKPAPVVKEAPTPAPVKALTFLQPHQSFDGRQSISAETAANKGLCAIEFHAVGKYARHHRVEFTKPDKAKRVFLIHESLVASWEPLA